MAKSTTFRNKSSGKSVRYMANDVKEKQPIKAICIPNTLQMSTEGKYFMGQTDTLIIGKGLNAWGGLINPEHSAINFHNTVVTISNFSKIPFLAQMWVNSTPPGRGTVSDMVSPANTSFTRPVQPKVELQYVQSINGTLTEGVNIFNRLIPPETTVVREDNGKLIFRPQGTFIVFLISSGPELVQANIAFGWWEQGC